MQVLRRDVRDSAFKILFEQLLRNDPVEELYAIAEEIEDMIINDSVKEMVNGTMAHLEELDSIIGCYSKSRELNRIPAVNRTILRIALYEILYDADTPRRAAINEAVLLAKEYGYDTDVSFVNGVLGAYDKDHPTEDAAAPAADEA